MIAKIRAFFGRLLEPEPDDRPLPVSPALLPVPEPDPRNAPGYGTCVVCRGAWNWKRPHDIRLDETTGIFPTCEDCWPSLDQYGRKRAVLVLMDQWRRFPDPGLDEKIARTTRLAFAVIEKEGP